MTEAELSRLLEPWILVWIGFFGACVGSFLNVVIFRLPRRCLSVFRPARSFCPKCRHAIRWYENLPIVSWAVILRARCAGCGLPISMRYPLVEAATMLLFVGAAAWHLPGRALEPAALGSVFVLGGLGSALLCCALIDWDLRIVPDAITVPGILLGPLALAAVPTLLGKSVLPDLEGYACWAVIQLDSPLRWWGASILLQPLESVADGLSGLARSSPGGYRALQGLWLGVWGATVAGGTMWAFSAGLERLLGRQALGFGDVKMTAMIGAFCGWKGALVCLLLASVLGTIAGLLMQTRADASSKEGSALGLGHLPFGPFLAIGGFTAAVGGERLLRALAL